MKRKYGEKVAESQRVYRETAIKTVFVALAVLLLPHFFGVAIVATIAAPNRYVDLHRAEQAEDEIVRARSSVRKTEREFRRTIRAGGKTDGFAEKPDRAPTG